MGNFLIRRILQTVIVVLVLSFICYALMDLMPGDPMDIACQSNPKCTPESLVQMRHVLGLDRPMTERYWGWLVSAFQGDFGYSRTYRLPVTVILGPRLVNTLVMSTASLVLSFVIAIPLGVFSSLRPNSKLDYSLNFFSYAGISMPSFLLSLLMIIVFAVKLGWLPASGTMTIGDEGGGLLDRARYLIMPVSVLSLLTIAGWVRYTRASMLEAMRSDYIRTAYAKGLRRRQVIMDHGLRNAWIPIVTIIALSLGGIFSGAVITETIFSYNGVGKLIFDAIMNNDFNLAMTGVVLTCANVLIMSLVADVWYAYLDPRITLE